MEPVEHRRPEKTCARARSWLGISPLAIHSPARVSWQLELQHRCGVCPLIHSLHPAHGALRGITERSARTSGDRLSFFYHLLDRLSAACKEPDKRRGYDIEMKKHTNRGPITDGVADPRCRPWVG